MPPTLGTRSTDKFVFRTHGTSTYWNLDGPLSECSRIVQHLTPVAALEAQQIIDCDGRTNKNVGVKRCDVVGENQLDDYNCTQVNGVRLKSHHLRVYSRVELLRLCDQVEEANELFAKIAQPSILQAVTRCSMLAATKAALRVNIS